MLAGISIGRKPFWRTCFWRAVLSEKIYDLFQELASESQIVGPA
jgi:hypothetical protein